jgi:protein SCO1
MFLRLRATALLLFGIAALAGPARAERLDAKLVEPPASLPAFALQDQSGRAFTPARLKGHWTLMAIGYTSCPDICPFTLDNLAKVVEALARRGDVAKAPQVVFVSVDPARDTGGLGKYVASFDPHFLGATGARQEIRTLVAALGDFYEIGKPDRSGDYEVAHSSEVSVIDPESRLRARLEPPMPPAETAAFLAGLMAKMPAQARLGQ